MTKQEFGSAAEQQRNMAGATPDNRSQTVSSVIVLKVRGYHVDVFGHVNHARYLEFLEEARWAFFEEWPALTAALHARGIIHVVVNINIDYKSQATVGDLLRIETAFDCSARPLIPMLCATLASFGWPSPMAKFRSRATFDSMFSPCRARVNNCSA